MNVFERTKSHFALKSELNKHYLFFLFFQAIQCALCFLHLPVTGSSAFMMFSKQFNTYLQGTLVRLKSCFKITSFVLCYPQFVVTVKVLWCSSPNSLISISSARCFNCRAALKSPISCCVIPSV